MCLAGELGFLDFLGAGDLDLRGAGDLELFCTGDLDFGVGAGDFDFLFSFLGVTDFDDFLADTEISLGPSSSFGEEA